MKCIAVPCFLFDTRYTAKQISAQSKAPQLSGDSSSSSRLLSPKRSQKATLYLSKPYPSVSVQWLSLDRIKRPPCAAIYSTISSEGYGELRYPRENAPVFISNISPSDSNRSAARCHALQYLGDNVSSFRPRSIYLVIRSKCPTIPAPVTVPTSATSEK